jgi:hypothetical protein
MAAMQCNAMQWVVLHYRTLYIRVTGGRSATLELTMLDALSLPTHQLRRLALSCRALLPCPNANSPPP